MSSNKNKQLMQSIFAEMAKGSLDPFVEIMAEDMQWSWMGTESWTRTFEGKESVVNELLAAVKATLTEPFEVIPHSFIADGDFVVIEHTGKNTTPDGRPYHNRYCWVCRFSNGKLRELREYMDTELVTKTFGVEGKPGYANTGNSHITQRVTPQLRSTNWSRTRAFYEDGLGFHVQWKHRFEPGFPVFAQVSRDGMSLFLTEHEGDCQVGGAAYFVVDDLNTFYREIKQRGVRIDEPPQETPWNTSEMSVIDPDGNRLRFADAKDAT
jgi:uncharacterized protein